MRPVAGFSRQALCGPKTSSQELKYNTSLKSQGITVSISQEICRTYVRQQSLYVFMSSFFVSHFTDDVGATIGVVRILINKSSRAVHKPFGTFLGLEG